MGPARRAAGARGPRAGSVRGRLGILGGAGDRPFLALPSDPADVTTEVAERVRQGFADLLGEGLAAESCRRLSIRTAVYLFGTVGDV